MTDPPPPDGEELEPVLVTFREAVHELYRASLPDDLRDPDADAAAAARALIEVRDHGVNRLFRLHAVASNLNRRPELIQIDNDPTRDLAEAIFEPGREEEQAVDTLEFGLRRFAQSASRTGSALTPARWRTFLHDINEPGFRGPRPEAAMDRAPGARDAPDPVLVYKPGCNDEEVTDAPAGAACTIRSRFYLDGELRVVGRFIDPRRWVTCGRPFWTEMSVESDFQGTDSAFTAVFLEKVVLPVVGEVTARLRITYAATPDYILTEYVVADDRPNPDVIVDNGWLLATRAHENGQARTLVDGVKSIRFVRDDLNDYPDLACDGAWVHFMINMALGGTALGRSADRVPPAHIVRPEKTAAGVAAGIGDAIDQWVAGAKGSLDEHGRHAKDAVSKALAEPSDPRWVNDVLEIYAGVPRSAEASMSTVRAVLDELGSLGGKR